MSLALLLWLLIIFILLCGLLTALWLLLIPEWGRWAHRHWQERQQLWTRRQAVAEAAQRLARVLPAFRRVRAQRARATYERCMAGLKEVEGHLTTLQALDSLPFTFIPAGQTTFAFFESHLSHLVHVPRVAYRLRPLRRALAAAEKTLLEVERGWEELHQRARELLQLAREMEARRLPALQSLLASTRQQEIGVDDWAAQTQQLHHQLHSIAESLRLEPRAPIPLLDEMEQQLERLQQDFDTLGVQLENVERERQKLDRVLIEAEQQAQALQRTLTTEGEGNELAPLLQSAQEYLREARQMRAHRHWPAAEARALVGWRWLELAAAVRRLNQALPRVQAFHHLARYTGEIEGLTRQRDQAVQEIYRHLLPQERTSLPALAQRLGEAAESVASLERAVLGLLASCQRETRRAEQQMETAWQEAEEAWRAAQQVALLHEDPLQERYARLQLHREAARTNPAGAAEFVNEAETVTELLRAAERQVRERLRQAEEALSRLPRQLKEARALAGNWLCLTSYVMRIETCLQQARDQREGVLTLGRLADTLSRLEQVNTLGLRATQAAQTVAEEAKKLGQLQREIDKCLEAAGRQPAEGDDNLRYMIELYRDKARRAQEVRHALDALREAHRFATRLLA